MTAEAPGIGGRRRHGQYDTIRPIGDEVAGDRGEAMKAAVVGKRILQGLGLLCFVACLAPFLLVSLAHFLWYRCSRESLYSCTVYAMPLLYELHNRLFTFPAWEANFQHLPDLPGHTLHLACGTGFGAGVIETKSTSTTHLDINFRFVRYARRCRRLHRTVVADAGRLPFGDGCFDTVVIPVAFHHMADHSALLLESSRVLKPGGRICIFEPVSLKERPCKRMNSFHDGLIWIFDRRGILDRTAPLLQRNGLELQQVACFRSLSLQNFNPVYPMTDLLMTLGRRMEPVKGIVS